MLLELGLCLSFAFSLYNDYKLTKINKNVSELVKAALDDPNFKEECKEIIREEGLQQLREKIEVGYYSRLANKIVDNRMAHHTLMTREKYFIGKNYIELM